MKLSLPFVWNAHQCTNLQIKVKYKLYLCKAV